ncbi:MAG: hypothetical protein JSS57_23725 [Proteobacteria bacterium]|nr:hypothetical protein [Pseudomonadota bacterium]
MDNLIQQLGSSSSTGTSNSALSTLQRDFQNLLKDAQQQSGATTSGSSSASSGQAPTLQSFLQALEKNLADRVHSPLGNNVNASA